MIRFAQSDDLPEIRSLWDQCFPDESGFNDYFFERIFSFSDTLLYLVDGVIAAMVQMLPYTLHLHGKYEPVTYIYGACTHPNFRRRHLMSKLLSYTFEWDRSHGRKASLLIPQEDWLFAFYRPFGYLPQFFSGLEHLTVVQKEDLRLRPMSASDLPVCAQLYQDAMQHYDMFIERTPAQWDVQHKLFQSLGFGAFVWETQGTVHGYAFAWKDETGLWIQELISPPEAQGSFLSALAFQAGMSDLRISGPKFEQHCLGCIKFYHDQPSMHGYMNLMLN